MKLVLMSPEWNLGWLRISLSKQTLWVTPRTTYKSRASFKVAMASSLVLPSKTVRNQRCGAHTGDNLSNHRIVVNADFAAFQDTRVDAELFVLRVGRLVVANQFTDLRKELT